MKKLLIALMLVSSAVHAEEWLELPNNAGGKILLLTSKCKGSDTGLLVISTIPKGINLHGCWYAFADMIHISWDSGQASSFDPNEFTYRKSK